LTRYQALEKVSSWVQPLGEAMLRDMPQSERRASE
jgi:hypothetical protein